MSMDNQQRKGKAVTVEPSDAKTSATAAPARRSQAERSEDTRKKVLKAAAQLMRTRGYGGLRTGEVAELAGVSRGAQLHQFATKNDLIVATLLYLNEKTLATSRRRAKAAQKSDDPIGELIADAKDFFFGDYFFIELTIGMADDQNQDLRQRTYPITRETRFKVEAAWLATLEAHGMPKQLAADVLAMSMSLVRGFAMRTLIDNDRQRFDALLKQWRDIMEDHIAAHAQPRSTSKTEITQ